MHRQECTAYQTKERPSASSCITHPQPPCGPASRPPCPRPGCPSPRPAQDSHVSRRSTQHAQRGAPREVSPAPWLPLLASCIDGEQSNVRGVFLSHLEAGSASQFRIECMCPGWLCWRPAMPPRLEHCLALPLTLLSSFWTAGAPPHGQPWHAVTPNQPPNNKHMQGTLTLPFIFLRSFLASERCHLGSQRSGSGGGPGLAGSKLQQGGCFVTTVMLGVMGRRGQRQRLIAVGWLQPHSTSFQAHL